MRKLLACYVKINTQNNGVTETKEYSKNIAGFDFRIGEIWNKKKSDSVVCYERISR